MCDTYNCDYLQHSTFRFNLIDFQLNADFPSQFWVFLPDNYLALLKDRFLKKREKRAKKGKKPAHFFRRTIGSNNSFTLIENNFWFLK